jgi:hypothetical protein
MNEKLKYKIRVSVEKLGLVQSLEMFGKDILKQVFIGNPLSFLDQFNNLKPIEKNDKIFYVDNDNLPLFYYYKEDQESKNGNYYINYYRIWSFFSRVNDYNYTEIQEIIEEWLGTTYNLRELTAQNGVRIHFL